jgi:hypothetical protein
MQSSEGKIVLRRIALFFSGLVLCWLLVHFGRTYLPLLWGDLRVVNFCVNITPTILSILFAFVIDKDLEGRVKMAWRAGIVVCGLLLSVLLWHQQTLADKQSDNQIQSAVNSAVDKSNKHADEQFNRVQDNVGNVQKQVTGLGQSLDDTKRAISGELQQTSSALNSSIGKVGKPEPPELAKLQFSLWKAGLLESQYPLKQVNVDQQLDGSVQVQFAVRNVSHVQAEAIDIWVFICQACSFAKEPEGFDNPKPNQTTVRHRVIPELNPGVAVGDNILNIKVNQPGLPFTTIAFGSTCKNCGAFERTDRYVIVLNSDTMRQR